MFKTILSSLPLLPVLAMSVAPLPSPALASGPVTNQNSSYAYPYPDNIDATLTTALLKSTRTFPELTFTGLVPGRDHIPYAVGRDQVRVSFARASRTAPLIFILTGLGASQDDGIGAFLEDHLQQAGFNVAVLPSPFNWTFTLTASQSGVPGVTSEDAADIYSLMQATLRRLRQERGVEPAHIGVLGYSMGAFEGAAVAERDRQVGTLGIDRFLLINPPVNLSHGMDVLDSMTDLGQTFPPGEADALMGEAMDWGARALRRNIADPSYFVNLDKNLPFTHLQREFLIGSLLRSCISDVALISQSIDDLGLFVGPANARNLAAREAQAHVMSFRSYFRRIAEPSWAAREGLSPESPDFQERLERQLSLKPHAAALARDSRIWLMHNADDFLLQPGDIAFLRSIFGARATIFPLGGHLGNLWYPENLRHILQVLAPLRDR